MKTTQMRTSEAVCLACSSRKAAPSLACWQSLKEGRGGGGFIMRGGLRCTPSGSCGLEEAVGGQLEVLQPLWFVRGAYLAFSGWS